MDPLLFGYNDAEKILAVHHISDSTMRIYTRGPSAPEARDVEFYPFFFLSDSSYLADFPAKHWVKNLAGANYFQFLCAFTRWSDMWDAIQHIMRVYNARSVTTAETFSELPVLHLRPDPVSQFLMQSGMTLFKGMDYKELHRMQLDIETYSSRGLKFSNPERLEDRIIVIALSDNRGWNHVLSGKQMNEKEMLGELVRIIQEKDVDVIEGHNIYNFDLRYITARCTLLGVEFAVGRDGSPLRSFDSRATFAERPVDYTTWDIPGRHIIDTWMLLQSYDVSKRTLESYGLKSAAQHFGFAKADRTYITPERIAWYWDHEPDLLIRYALDDVEETRLLSEYLSPPYFYLAQAIPFNYGTLARIGSAAKIESLILREYVRQKHSVSRPEKGMQTTGGYTDIFFTGILGPIVDIDFESLYPSIMLREKILPRTEKLGVFGTLLDELTRMRLEAKRKMEQATDASLKSKHDAIQSSFKILINSFYGYLGYSRALFNDIDAADSVTRTGQSILRRLIDAVTTRGGTVVMVDTDGIFFMPPEGTVGQDAEKEFVEKISRDLPPGMSLAINGRYRRLLSYKKKNYALLGYDDKVRIKGSSLNSRNIEKFGRQYIRQCIDALLSHDIDGLHRLYVNLRKAISEHKLTVEDFARVETLKEGLEEYADSVKAGDRKRTASYEVAIASGTKWNAGERISYYITGNEISVKEFEHGKLADEWDPNFPDENTHHYVKRLDEISRKFEVFFKPQDFRAIFSLDDLFPFSTHGIDILTIPLARAAVEQDIDESEVPHVAPTIWFDEG